jgi:CheY-like chemotaxis protein
MTLQSLSTAFREIALFMARNPSVAQTEQMFRPLSTVRKLAIGGRCCVNCKSVEIRPSKTRNALDIVLACVLLVPFRCRVCRIRFYRVWRPGLHQTSEPPPVAPLYLISPRHKLLNLDSFQPQVSDPPRVDPPLVDPPPVSVAPTAEAVNVKEPVRTESVPATPELPLQPLPASAPGHILILENDLSIRKLLRRLLDRRGYSTVEISQAEDLASELRGRPADLLVIDVAAAGHAGLEAVLEVARVHSSLKILALSAESLKDYEIPGRLLALPKPFPLESFVDCVDRLLQPVSPAIGELVNRAPAVRRRFDHS